mgnify:CR=1 FL=1|jgi:DNA-binding CsgD family transcriptional regulator
MLTNELEILSTKLIKKNVFQKLHAVNDCSDLIKEINTCQRKVTIHDIELYKPVCINNELKKFYGFTENDFTESIDYLFYLTTIHPYNIGTLMQTFKFIRDETRTYLNLFYTLLSAENNWIKFYGITKIIYCENNKKPKYAITLMEEVDKLPKKVNIPNKTKLPYISISEQKILELLIKDLTTKEIALKLNISVNTINTHRQNLIEKLQVKSSLGLVKRAIELGLTEYLD